MKKFYHQDDEEVEDIKVNNYDDIIFEEDADD